MTLAVASWPEFHGACLMRGVRPLTLPLPWLLDLIHGWAVEGTSTRDKAKWTEQLWLPPDDVDPDDSHIAGWDDDELLSGFQVAMARQRQGR